jgi:S1-C subfamily serine protease
MRTLTLISIAVWVVFSSLSVLAQDAVPGEILERTLFIKAGNEAGTAFMVDYQGKAYLVTAKHVVAGLPENKATIQVWQQDQWKDYHAVKTLFPSSGDVDIAVFETAEKVPKPYVVAVVAVGSMSGPTMGQQVWFLGYPWGIGSRWSNGVKAPFIKRGTMSAIDATKPDAIVIYIDGFNNPGFSGGPIVYWDFSQHAYRILGVVKGYKEDTAKVLINGAHVDTQLLVNSGILVAYSIEHAMKAIEESQKQPLAK